MMSRRIENAPRVGALPGVARPSAPASRARSSKVLSLAFGAVVFLFTFGCGDGEPPTLPSASEVESYYLYPQGLEASMEGTVAEIRAIQPTRHLERGGRLWARSGPYILLFSEETRSLFQDHPDLTGVQVTTVTPDGVTIARASLHRDALTGTQWRRSLNLSGLARREGTDQPTRLEDLVQWGEEYTEHEYAPRFQESG